MAKTGADLSSEFNDRATEFAELIRGLDDEQWHALCEAENWSVGTTAHHVGQSFNSTWGITEAIMAGSVPPVSWDDINAMNAAHAAEFPNPDRAETLALIEDSAASVTEAIAALDDEALDKSAVVAAFSPEPLAARNWIEMVVIGHIGMHKPSIEAATSS
ncbi:MAG: DinB family protein [Thermomicrobiales bacterium]